jgi:hypothetical protein
MTETITSEQYRLANPATSAELISFLREYKKSYESADDERKRLEAARTIAGGYVLPQRQWRPRNFR